MNILKILKYTSFSLLGLLLLLLIGIAVFITTFDPNRHKELLTNFIKNEKQRTLTIDGPISLNLYPKLSISLAQVSLSDKNSAQLFLEAKDVRIAMAVLPLLRGKWVVDYFQINSFKANLLRNPDGTTNFDDLIDQQDNKDTPQFDVNGLNISNSALSFKDLLNKKDYHFSQINIKSGRITPHSFFPFTANFVVHETFTPIALRADLKGDFMIDPDKKHFQANKANIFLTGDVQKLRGIKFDLSGDIDTSPSFLKTHNLKSNLSSQLQDKQNAEMMLQGDVYFYPQKEILSLEDVQVKISANGKDRQSIDLQLFAPKLMIDAEKAISQKITLHFSRKQNNDLLEGDMFIQKVSGNGKNFKIESIDGNLTSKQGERNIQTNFTGLLNGNLKDFIFNVPLIDGKINLKDKTLAHGAVSGGFHIGFSYDHLKQLIKASYRCDVETMKLDGNVVVRDFTHPNILLKTHIDDLDLNQWMNKKTPPPTSPKESPLSTLAKFSLKADVQIDKLKYQIYQVSKVNLGANLTKDSLILSPLQLSLDDSSFKGKLSITQFSDPRYQFLLNIDQIDADRYLTSTGGGDENTPIRLDWLNKINLVGELNIGKLKFANIKTQNTHLKMASHHGVTELRLFSANLYGGSMTGSFDLNTQNVPTFLFKQSIQKLAVGEFVKDAINSDMLSGKGDLNLEVKTRGNTIAQIKRNMDGQARFLIQDGALKGIDIAGNIRKIKSKLNVLKQTKVTNDQSQKTDFAEMKASFDIRKGMAYNKDLDIKNPLFRIQGEGSFGIAKQTIDYLAKAKLVNSLRGQGGGDFNLLAGVVIPIKISGTFVNPSYSLDFAGILQNIVPDKIQETVQDIGKDAQHKAKSLIQNAPQKIINQLIGGEKQNNTKTDSAKYGEKSENASSKNPDKPEDKLKKLFGISP